MKVVLPNMWLRFEGVANLAQPKELQDAQLCYIPPFFSLPVWTQYAHGSNYSGYHHSQAEQEHRSLGFVLQRSEKNLSARTNARLLIATRADAESFILTLAAVFLLCEEREERLYLQTLKNISHRLAEFYEIINRSKDIIVMKDKRLDVRR